jgi:hypothetical protein
MWRYEHGWRVPVEKLEAIARECQVTVDALLKGVAEEKSVRGPITWTQTELLDIAQRGLQAAQANTQEAFAKFDAELREHYERLQKKR